jgi:hypothetical protein
MVLAANFLVETNGRFATTAILWLHHQRLYGTAFKQIYEAMDAGR